MNYAATVSRMGSVWPPDACLQGLTSNHPMLLRSKVVVVSVGEKADLIRQVSDGKVSARKPLMTHRNAFQLLSKRAEDVQPGSVWALPAYGPNGSRCIDGTSSSQALIRNVGTWLGMLRKRIKWPQP